MSPTSVFMLRVCHSLRTSIVVAGKNVGSLPDDILNGCWAESTFDVVALHQYSSMGCRTMSTFDAVVFDYSVILDVSRKFKLVYQRGGQRKAIQETADFSAGSRHGLSVAFIIYRIGCKQPLF